MHKLLTIVFLCMSLFSNICYAKGKITDTVNETIPCQEGNLILDAQIVYPETTICYGEVVRQDFALNGLFELYGEANQWMRMETGENTYRYISNILSDEVYIGGSWDENYVVFEVKYPQTMSVKDVLSEDKEAPPEEVLAKLGVVGEITWENDTHLRVKGSLNGVPTAHLSPVIFSGGMEYQDKHLVYAFFNNNFKVSQTKPAELLSINQLLERLRYYANIGMLYPLENVTIDRIKLEYYLEEVGDKTTFRPVWNFCAVSVDDSDIPYGEDYIYLDAQDGKMLEYKGY